MVLWSRYANRVNQMGQRRGAWTAIGGSRWVDDGWNRIALLSPSNAVTAEYAWGLDASGSLQGAGGVGGLLATRLVSSSNTDYFPTYDGNGNVSEYLGITGNNVAHYEYDPFGTLTRRTGSTSTRLQYRFSTKPRDFNTGLYYYGYRWYDPVTGRWPSRDPIEERGGVNLYGFVGNDGVNGLDVLGLATVADVNRTIENLRRKYEDSDFVKATRFESALRKFRALAPSYTVVHLPPGQANDPGGQWDYNFNEMRLPHIISDDAVILHELTHAYNDINNTGLSKMDDEGMAHVMHYSLRQMDFLNAIERDVKTSSSCEELKGFVQGYWPMYWDTSSHYSDWGEKHWKDWSRRKFSDNLKQGDFVNVDNHLGANFSCSRLRDWNAP